MKMTDESALAVLDELIAYVRHYGPSGHFPHAEECRDHIAARLAADQQKGGGEGGRKTKIAPLNGGHGPMPDGSVAWLDMGIAEAELVFHKRGTSNRSRSRHVMALFEGLAPGYHALYLAPQPSIPAPAQQEVISPSVGDWPAEMTVGKAMAAQRYIRDWTPDYVKDYIDSISPAQQDGKASGGDENLLADLDDYLQGCPDPANVWPKWMIKKASRLLWRCRTALAHPPHADQETQG